MSTPQTVAPPIGRVVEIPAGSTRLEGVLTVPSLPLGVVAFAHGSGSGRFSPRNQTVAEALQSAGMSTLLLDLLDEEEAQDRARVFDIGLLASRLLAAADWLAAEPATRDLPLGCFGASTGAGAALVAAARRPWSVAAVVSRGGRPDLAGEHLAAVTAPTLLIVGSRDAPALELNRQALAQLTCPKQLVVIPGATHLFPEPGTLEEVCRFATAWFVQNLQAGPD
jgi:putative phosphoribosyl transferase